MNLGATAPQRDADPAGDGAGIDQQAMDLAVETMAARVAVFDDDGKIRAINGAWRGLDASGGMLGPGSTAPAGVGASYLELARAALQRGADGAALAYDGILGVLRGEQPHFRFELSSELAAERRWTEISVRPLGEGRAGFLALHVDITERKRAESISALQSRILEQIAAGRPVKSMLEQIARAVEEQLPTLLCSILRLDADGVHLRLGSAPSLPEAYNAAIDGIAIGPKSGSCGTASFRRQPVIVTDIAADPLWADFAELALGHGLRACWSYPIFPTRRPTEGEPEVVLGAFAIYSRSPRAPDAWAERVATWASHLASLALELDRTNRALRESEQRFHALARASPVGIFRTDRSGACTYVNRRWCIIAGATLAEALENRWAFAIHDEDRPTVFAAWTEAVTHERPFHLEYRFATPEGKITWVLGQADPELDEHGAFVGFVGTITDISDRKQAELSLLTSTERFRILAKAANDAIWDWDLASNRVWWNAGVTQLFGYVLEASEADPAWWLDRVHPDERPAIEADFLKLVHGDALTWEDEYRFRRADGSYADVYDRGHVLRDEQGAPTRMIGAMMDITRQKQAETQLRELNRDLELRVEARTAELVAANKELESFSYSVSHDLRAPLRAIDGFSRIVLEDHAAALPKEAVEYLDEVRKNTRRMGELIDDLLSFSRLSRQPLDKRSLSTEALVRRCVDGLLGVPGVPGARRIEIVVAPDLPRCEADPSLLEQVWLNLLGNAIKYSNKRDPARIEVGWLPAAEQLTYFVRDNGVGFDMRYAHKLFGVFQRLHRAEDYEGTGVGLATVERVIHRHGGRIWAEAAPDRGATFFFTLPSPGAAPHA